MKPKDLNSNEWNFRNVPIGLETDAFQYELWRERRPKGYTLECLKKTWPWFERKTPWLDGWSRLDSNQRKQHTQKAEAVVGIQPIVRLSPRSSSIRVPEGLVTYLKATGSDSRLEEDLEGDPDFGSKTNTAEPPTWSVEAFGINWGHPDNKILEAFKAWLKSRRQEFAGSLPPPSDQRQRGKAKLQMLGAFRLARYVSGGSNHFQFSQKAFAQLAAFVGRKLGAQYQEREAWVRAIRHTRQALGLERIAPPS